MGTLATVVTSAFLLTVILNYPFAGDVSVSNEPLKQGTLARFWSEELAYRRQPGDRQLPLTAQRLEGRVELRRLRHARPALPRPGGARRGARVPAGRHADARRVPLPRRHRHGPARGGVFSGWWTESPGRRRASTPAGRVAAAGDLRRARIVGAWAYLREPLQPGWDLEEIGGSAPPDLRKRFAELSAFRADPRGSS